MASTTATPQYCDPYEAFVRCTASSQAERALALGHIFEQLQPSGEPRGLDIGVGSGDGTAWMLEHLKGVRLTAVEPDAGLCRKFEERFRGHAGVTIVNETVEAWLRGQGARDVAYDIALLLHVLYHIPRDAWASLLMQLDASLSPSGALLVSIEGPESDYAEMIRHFGGQAPDIVEFFDAFRTPLRYVVKMVVSWSVRAGSLEELEPVLRFLLADIPWQTSPAAEEVREYARAHFRREDGSFGFEIPDHLYVVTQSEAMARRVLDRSPLPARLIWAGSVRAR